MKVTVITAGEIIALICTAILAIITYSNEIREIIDYLTNQLS